MAKNTTRPGGVTFIATLCAVVGILELATGILSLLFARTIVDQSEMDVTQVRWAAVALIVLGLAYVLVSIGLYRGRDLARVIVLLISLLHAVNGLILAVTGQLVPGLVMIAVALVVSALLWLGRGGAYFERAVRAK